MGKPTKSIQDELNERARRGEAEHAGAIGEALYGIPNAHPRPKDWNEDWSITVEPAPPGNDVKIRVKLPHAFDPQGDRTPIDLAIKTTENSATHRLVMTLWAALDELDSR